MNRKPFQQLCQHLAATQGKTDMQIGLCCFKPSFLYLTPCPDLPTHSLPGGMELAHQSFPSHGASTHPHTFATQWELHQSCRWAACLQRGLQRALITSTLRHTPPNTQVLATSRHEQFALTLNVMCRAQLRDTGMRESAIQQEINWKYMWVYIIT